MITVTLAPCHCVDKPFAAATKETVAFAGVEVADGLQAGLFDGAGTCLAIGTVQGGQVELDLDTQEAVDAASVAGPGEAVTAWLMVGDGDTHIATVRCALLRNLIDDAAFHPPAPIPAYWTKEQTKAAIDEAIAKHNAESTAHADIRKALAEEAAARSNHERRTDNPHAVTAEQTGALTLRRADLRYVRLSTAEETVLNNLARAIRFYAHNAGEAGPDGNSPFFVIGSQLNADGSLKEDRWCLKIFYNAFEFLTTPGAAPIRLAFNRPGEDKATSDAIVLWKELVAALAAKAGADNDFTGTNLFRGIMRMANPRVSANADDATKDIALVPNADGAGLQVQFPGGATAMIRMKTGTLAITQEVNEALAKKQDKLAAGENVTLTPQADGTVKIDAENNAIPKNMATGRFPNGTEKPIIDIVWDVESIYGRYAYYFSAFLDNSQVVKFLIGQDGEGSLVERDVPTKSYVDGLVGDIQAALAQI